MSDSRPENTTHSSRLRLLAVMFLVAVLVVVAGAAYVRFSTFTFVVLGDNRPPKATDSQPKAFSRLLKMVRQEHADFVVSTGDVVAGSGWQPDQVVRQYDQLKSLVGALGVPFYVARGNHDAMNPELFDSFTGRPRYYSFRHRGAMFWILDTESKWAPGSIDRDQLAWLKQDLASHREYRRKFVVLHRPLIDPKRASRLPSGHQEFVDPAQDRRLKRLFAKEGVEVVFEGHIHMYSHTKYGSVNYIVTGGGGSPLYATEPEGGYYHYVVVRVGPFGVSAQVVRLSGRRQEIKL